MFKNSFGYLVKEGLHNIRANRQMSVASIGVLIACMVLIGGALLLSLNINSLMGYVESFNEVVVWIDDDLGSAGTERLKAEIDDLPNIASKQYISKEDALKELSDTLGSQSFLEGFEQYADENPLPASFAIEMDDPSQVESTAKKLKKNADFQKIADDGDVNASVLYGQEEVSRLFQVTNYIRIAAVVLVGLLTFIAFIFINNTIRLSITARRREIAIMRLVGASNGFIRGPFITEGVLQAILGSLLSIGVLELLRNLMIPRLQESIGWMSFALPMQYYLVTYAALILVGVIIGLFGSAIAMRRYLRV